MFIKSTFFNKNDLILFIPNYTLYFIVLHIKLSSIFYKTLVIDMFSFDSFINGSKTQNIFCVFFNLIFFNKIILILHYINNVKSFSNLFNNMIWIEREVSELNNIFFQNKKDVRNLLLLYGDKSYPFLKSFPVIGFKDFSYFVINDNIINKKIILQF